jgi:hypothetical protein
VFGFVNTAVYFNKSIPANQSNIIYSIDQSESDDLYQQFRINFKTGGLYVRSKVDYELKPTYTLTVRAHDSLNSRLQFATCRVRIELIDINDMTPEFDNYEYKVSINENLPAMSEIYRLNATDLDTDFMRNNEVRYKLLTHTDLFYINELTGIVYNKVTLDYEKLKNIPTLNESVPGSNNNEYVASFAQNSIQLRISAYDMGMIYEKLTLVPRSLKSTCVLTITIANVNDNSPQFDRTVYFSQVFIDEDADWNETHSPSQSIQNVLIDSKSNRISNGTHHFVTKVSGKDIDLDKLKYSIVKQTYEDQIESKSRQIIEETLFGVDSRSGIVVLNRERFEMFKNTERFLTGNNARKQQFLFNLQLAVSDGLYTSFSRLNVQLNYVSRLVPPRFVKPEIEFTLDLVNQKSNFMNLIEVDRLVETRRGGSDYVYEINLDQRAHRMTFEIFSVYKSQNRVILNANLTMALFHLEKVAPANIYQVPILCCDRIQTGVCDQILVLVNILKELNTTRTLTNTTVSTNVVEEKPSLYEIGKNIGFLYHFYGFTIQQQSELLSKSDQKSLKKATNSTKANTFESFYDDLTSEGDSLLNNNNEYDYYTDEPYESNERFYFELKTIDLTSSNSTENSTEHEDFVDYEDQTDNGGSSRSNERNKHLKYEFGLNSCLYSHLNVTFTNATVAKQIKQFTQLKNLHHSVQLSNQQLRQLFSLNKHNGVLSSRKIINLILPGVYLFNVTLKISHKPQNNQTNVTNVEKVAVDSMQYRLVILPPNSMLKPAFKYLYNYFKFDKEFYKFKFNPTNQTAQAISFGQINLLNKYVKLKSSPKPSSFVIEYEFAENKFSSNASSIYSRFQMNRTSGQVSIDLSRGSFKVDDLKPYLNDEYELVLYAVARVRMDSLVTNHKAHSLSKLEYTCEININCNQFVIENEVHVVNKAKKTDEEDLKHEENIAEDPSALINFGSSGYSLKVDANIRPNTKLYRFVALLNPSKLGIQNSTVPKIHYFMSTNTNLDSTFAINSQTGELTLKKQLTNNLPVLNVTACLIEHEDVLEDGSNSTECSSILVDFVLLSYGESANGLSAFEFSQYNGTIRDDSLPGTIITTLSLNENVLSMIAKDRSMEFFIMGTDTMAGQFFAVANDGKVYTRLMIDTGSVVSKTRYQMNLDLVLIINHRFKCASKLTINVLNVINSGNLRPNCPAQNLVKFSLNENVPLGYSIFNLKGKISSLFKFNTNILNNFNFIFN